MTLMPLPPRRISDPAEVIRQFAVAAPNGLRALWCNHDATPPPDADWRHSGITRVPFLVLCLAGSFQILIREHGHERLVTCRAGSGVLHAPGAYAWHRHRGPSRMLTATCDSDLLLLGVGQCRRARDLDDPEDFLPMRALVVQPPPPEPCLSLAHAALACPAGADIRRLALGRALLWQLAAAAAAARLDTGQAPALRAWIAEHATRPGLGRRAVARTFGISPTHVSRILAPWGGLAAEIEQARLARAIALLRADPATPLGTVATTCGFVDASHLIRRFRHRHGITPGAWRRAHSG